MNMKLVGALVVITAAGAAYYAGLIPHLPGSQPSRPAPAAAIADATAPTVSALKVAAADFVETVLITGSVVARDEILVAPEIAGFRVLELLADEGDTVTKGQVLARLANETLQAQLAQNEANIARTEAVIAVARSTIVQAEATVKEASNAFERAKPLKDQGIVSSATFDQRELAANAAQSRLVSARDSLKSAAADKAATEAQRRELAWKLERSEVRAPSDGIISRRTARLGAVASAGSDPMFRIIARGEVELDADIAESDVGKAKEGQNATVTVTGSGEVRGTIRMISSEVDRSTRLGKVKIFFGVNPALRLGAFGRGSIETGRSHGLSVPTSAVVYTPEGATVQLVSNGRVETRRVKTGLTTKLAIEILEGVTENDIVVARSGSFLRDGDAVLAVIADTKVSGVR